MAASLPGFATGGFTGRGGKHEVAGLVHKGEYVLPKEQVDQTTGLPKRSSSSGVTIESMTINNYTPIDQQAMIADIGWDLSRKIA